MSTRPRSARSAPLSGYLVGPGAVLWFATLSGEDLSGANLTETDLFLSDLSGTNLSGADLTNADLAFADLTGTDLTDTTLRGVFSESITGEPAALPAGWELRHGYLLGPGVDLHDEDLSGLDLSNLELSGANLTGTTFTGADLTGTIFTGAFSTVDTLADESDTPAGPDHSLREALRDIPPGATVNFAPSLTNQTIVLGSGRLILNRNLTLDGETHGSNITIDGNNLSTVFLQTSVTVTIEGLTITGGDADAGNGGGGILTLRNSNLILTRCTITGNHSSQGIGAGGIRNDGTMELNRCSILNNTADTRGGGIYNTGILTVRDSTFAFNRAGIHGAAIMTRWHPVLIENSTITQNTTDTDVGAGIWSQDAGTDVILRHVTVATNVGSRAAGNFSGAGVTSISPATLTLENTIIGDNFALPPISADLLGDVTTIGANLVEWHHGTVLSGPTPIREDPWLARVGNYLGGSTPTMPPLPGSAVIEAGVLTGDTPPTDQRGTARPTGPRPDLGATEAFAFSSINFLSADGDTIPDYLEGSGTEWSHLDPTLDDSALDSDGDRRTDAQEIAEMTDPFDHNDYFRILSIGPTQTFDAQSNPLVEVTASTFPGVSYEFQADSTLENFQLLPGSTFVANDFTETIQLLLAPGGDFVRAVRK